MVIARSTSSSLLVRLSERLDPTHPVLQEIEIILIDVSPHMHPHLDDVSAALSNFALAKVGG